jgi:Flp pilus assembly protein TadD
LHPQDKVERSIIKIIGWTLGIIIFLIVAGVLGHSQYYAWQERRLVAQANALINEGDLKRASLDARRILQINPDSPAGCRIMARVSEVAGLRTAVDWRRRVVELEPNNMTDMLALARAAVRFNDSANRDYALSRLNDAARATPEFHSIAADMALAKREGREAERHLREALRLEPENTEHQLRLAALQLGSTNPQTAAAAKATLQQLRAAPQTRLLATRRLIEYAMQRGDYDEAVQLGREIDQLPERNFGDRLLLISALHRSADPAATPLLEELKTEAAQHPEQVAELVTWFNVHQMPAAAISWATRLPEEARAFRSVPLALADSYVALGDWQGLERIVKEGNWGTMDYLRVALAARARRELGLRAESDALWREAVKKVSVDLKQALTLAEIVTKWGWRSEAVELLWVVAKDPAQGDGALQALYRHFAENGDTRELYRVLLHREQLRPNDRDVQNNLAQISMLLNMNVERGHRLARDLYEKEPQNPIYVSTYAFALYHSGEPKKAADLMAKLGDDQLQQPELAAYYGIFLAAAGEHQRAAEFLDLGEKAGLLPEERALLERARRTIAQR